MSQTSDPLDIIFSPAQVARTGTAYIEERVSNRNNGIPFYLPSIDQKFLPLLPGELCTIVGRPGAGKSAVMMHWARQREKYLSLNQITDRVVVYITYESHIEELYALTVAADVGVPIDAMARGQLDSDQIELVRDCGVRHVAKKIWLIGHSQEKRKKRPRIDLTSVSEALSRIENWNMDGKRDLKIDIIYVDYLQRIPFEGRPESKIIGIDENLNKLKDMGLQFSCPVVVGSQARREVDDRQVQIPELNDSQWSSAGEQVSDKMLSVVRPIKYRHEGESFGKTLVEGRNQMVIAILKQKMGDAPFVVWTIFDPQYNRMIETEERNYNFNKERGYDV
jgi:replicative DNA helicase